jgi:excisionase family DNA binding protein
MHDTSAAADWLTSSEVAERYVVSERTVQRWAERGVLPATRFVPLGPLRFDPRDVEALLERATQGAAA